MKQILAIENFYQEVDEKVKTIEQYNLDILKCGIGCAECCVDEITVFTVEADNIKHNFQELLKNELPYQEGKCAFLDKDLKCRIYNSRPYVCRTQGLPLRWFEEDENENILEYRDICPINEDTELLERDEQELWLIGPYEEKLQKIQTDLYGTFERKSLRTLFFMI